MLVLPAAVRDDIVAHAREGRPEEVCGVLAGERGEGEEPSRVERVYRASNAAERPRVEYAIDPEEQLQILEGVEAAGSDVVGFYHSHPAGPAGPSETDRARATWTGYAYLIVSLGGAEPTAGSWRWTGEAFERERVELTRSP